jgi:uncharacterized protein YaaQ
MYEDGLISDHIWESMSKPIKQHADALAEVVSEVLHADPRVEEEVFETTMREILASQRSTLNMLLRNGIISEETFSQLVIEVDIALASPNMDQLEIMLNRQKNPITELMAVVLQESDVENVNAVLDRLGVPSTRLSSSGGFLGRKNTTILVGVPDGKENTIIKAIGGAGKKRVEVLPYNHGHVDRSASVTIEAATIFTFDVERYEEC